MAAAASTSPNSAPSNPMKPASIRKMVRTAPRCMPTARMVPISRMRSSSTIRNVFTTPTMVMVSRIRNTTRLTMSSTRNRSEACAITSSIVVIS